MTYALLVAACAPPERRQSFRLESAVGRILLENDRIVREEGFSDHTAVVEAVFREYELGVRDLPADDRARFFWAVSMNIQLETEPGLRFFNLVRKDSKDQFIRLLEQFLEASAKAKTWGSQQKLARGLLKAMKVSGPGVGPGVRQ